MGTPATVTARMKNPAMIITEAMAPVQALGAAASQGGVPAAIWDEAARHYDERGLAALLLTIATTNFYNRLNVPTRQVAGGSWG